MNLLQKQVMLGGVCLLAWASQAMADALSDAKSAYAAGDYVQAEKLYKPLAKQGNVKAQLSLGMMYDLGLGVPQDYKEAANWYRLAAEKGDKEGQYNLGIMYARELGVPQDYILAHMWMSLSGKYPAELAFVAKQMSAEQIAKAQELGIQCIANKFKGC